MKNVLVILSLLSVFSCKTQKCKKAAEVKEKADVSMKKPSENLNTKFFVGKWKKTKTEFVYYKSADKKVVTKNRDQCEDQSYWQFTSTSDGVVQTRKTAVKDCNAFISTRASKIRFENGRLIYFVDDVGYALKVQKLNDNQFMTTQKEIIGTDPVIMKVYYQRK